MLRFPIRDLLWLTVVVALAVGWLMHYWRSDLKAVMLESYVIDLEFLNGKYEAALRREGFRVHDGADGPFLVRHPKLPQK